MAEWFETWFGEEYLRLYPHRDDADAEKIVGLILRTLPWRAGWRVLDVGCGPGRHARAFAASAGKVTGLDLSMPLLRRAQSAAAASFVCADLRELPIRQASMDLTVNLFTSFGYFADDEQHRAALVDMVGTLRPGGWFAIDFLNAARVRRELVAEEVVLAGSGQVRVTRNLTPEGGHVIKTIETPTGDRFIERVRLFEAGDLTAMIESAGAVLTHQLGDYAGAPLTPFAPRCILFARKN